MPPKKVAAAKEKVGARGSWAAGDGNGDAGPPELESDALPDPARNSQAIEDKTFGLKNKKSKTVQK
jgi:hypothetical protein